MILNYKYIVLFLLLVAKNIEAQVGLTDSVTCDNHGSCCSNDPTPSGIMIIHVHKKNEWMVSYRFMRMNLKDLLNGSNTINDDEVLNSYIAVPKTMQMDMHMLMLMYGVSDKLTAMLMFNYNINYMKMSMKMGNNIHNQNMNSSGIGDIKISILHSLIKKQRSQLLIGLGLSLPPGNINFKGETNSMMYADERYPYNMQLGSGTFDVLPYVSYLTQKNKWFFSSQLSSSLRTGYNSVGYRYGNDLTLNAWVAWQWCSFISSSLRIEGISSEKIKGNDSSLNQLTEISGNTSNYGGKKIFCYLGSIFQAKKGIFENTKLSIEYGLPFYQNVNGLQMKQTNNINLSWNFIF